MAIQSSGAIRLRGKGDGRGINEEVNGNITDTNVSLRSLSTSAGFSAPDTMREFYGYTSCTVPSVSTNNASSVGETSMTLNGNVTNDNGCEVTSRGFYFGTSSTYNSNTKITVGSGTGTYSTARTGLSSGVTYYSTAWAINSEGEAVGTTRNSTTPNPIIPVTATSITYNQSCRYNKCFNVNPGYQYFGNDQHWYSSAGSFSNQETWQWGMFAPQVGSVQNTCGYREARASQSPHNCTNATFRNGISPPAPCGSTIRTFTHVLQIAKSGYSGRSYSTYTTCIYCSGGTGPGAC